MRRGVALAVGLALIGGCGGESNGSEEPAEPPGEYIVTIAFDESTGIEPGDEVRIGGDAAGHVAEIDAEGQAVLEIDPEFAPIEEGTDAVLRAKTLLGDTYVELIPEDSAGATTTEITPTELREIHQALDPETRQGFQNWQKEHGLNPSG